MRLEKVQDLLQRKGITYSYNEEEGCGSIDFLNKGLPYHIWEYEDRGVRGVETNLFHVGRSVDLEEDYEQKLLEELENWTAG